MLTQLCEDQVEQGAVLCSFDMGLCGQGHPIAGGCSGKVNPAGNEEFGVALLALGRS